MFLTYPYLIAILMAMSAIRKYREQKKLTQEQFGRLAGVQKAAVSKWEDGLLVPPMRAIVIEKKTKGELPRWLVRPDLWSAPR